MKQLFSTPPEIATAFALIGFSALATLVAAPAQAVILDFESLEQNSNINYYIGTPGDSYTEKGFTISDAAGALQSGGTQSNYYPGSTGLFSADSLAVFTLSQVSGGSFTLSSIDLSTLSSSDPQGRVTTVSFTGTKADSSIVTQSFTTDAVGTSLETFNFTNFTNLVAVNWDQGSFPYHQFDNINVSASSSTAVPEPFTILGTIFGAGYGVSLKRKLAKAQADKQDIT